MGISVMQALALVASTLLMGGFVARLILHRNWGNILIVISGALFLIGDYLVGQFVNPLSNPQGAVAIVAAVTIMIVGTLDFFEQRRKRAAALKSGDCCSHD